MKKSQLAQSIIFTLFFCFFAVNPAFSQDDLAAKISKLPAANGTYHLTTVDGVKFYGVKKEGKIVEVMAKEKNKTERFAMPESAVSCESRLCCILFRCDDQLKKKKAQ